MGISREWWCSWPWDYDTPVYVTWQPPRAAKSHKYNQSLGYTHRVTLSWSLKPGNWSQIRKKLSCAQKFVQVVKIQFGQLLQREWIVEPHPTPDELLSFRAPPPRQPFLRMFPTALVLPDFELPYSIGILIFFFFTLTWGSWDVYIAAVHSFSICFYIPKAPILCSLFHLATTNSASSTLLVHIFVGTSFCWLWWSLHFATSSVAFALVSFYLNFSRNYLVCL